MPEPYELTATQAAAAIRARTLTSPDLVESLLERITRLDPFLHAWVRLNADGARAEARACAAELAEGRTRGPLHGVPVGLKDIYFTAGLGTEGGSAVHAGFVPDEDAVTVARLRAAGAIVLGKTETTQFAYADPAPTRNPWNLEHTPGGSSSGSAAAVAARMVPAALGTQTAGSILRPAAFCGVVGFKPTAGRVSLEGIFPLAWSLDQSGPIVRSVEDARLLFSLLDETAETPAAPAEPRAPSLGLLRGAFLDRAEPGALAQFEETAGRLARAGASVRDVSLPDDFDLTPEVHHVIMMSEAAAYHASDHARLPDAYRPALRAAVEIGSLLPATAYLQAQRLRAELAAQVVQCFADVDCLIMPSALGVAPEGLTSTGNAVFNAPWSLFGMPSLTIPSGLSASALPYGLQLAGPRVADYRVLQAGEWCEGVLGVLPLPTAMVIAAKG